MQQIYNQLSIGLKFKLGDLVKQINDTNYKLYAYILHEVHISDENGDEINTEYKNLIRELDVYWDKDEFLEKLSNLPTENDGNIDILEYYCVFDVKQVYQGQHDFYPRGGNVQAISIDKMMQAINEDLCVFDRNKNPIDLSLLPPYEKVISLFTELIE
jgi:hypothetical protein